MPKNPENKPIECEYFAWHLRSRNGVYYADGRGGKYDLGKHSLGTRNRAEALKQLHQLDRKKAVELGLAKETSRTFKGIITIEQGWDRYLEYSGRSPILGGVAPGSLKRYTLIQDRHLPYCRKKGIETWNEFGKSAFEQYGNWLFRKFAYRTCYVDLTQIKSAVKWMIGENLLPADCQIHYPLQKPQGTDTYCYSQAEFTAMIEQCSPNPKLNWLGDMIVALAHLGVRLGELTTLHWRDVDLQANVIRIQDERASRRKTQAGTARTTKGRRSRTIPIHPVLKKLLFSMERQSDGRVFHAMQGGAIRENNALKIFKEQVLQPLSKRFPTAKGEIGFAQGTFHSFRHYFCSQCFLGGASEGEIRSWLGHAESKMVEHYRHLRNEDATRKMEQINFLGDPLKSDPTSEAG